MPDFLQKSTGIVPRAIDIAQKIVICFVSMKRRGCRMGKTLADLQPGESGTVAQVGGEGALHRHLLDMGLTPRTQIKVEKLAPMGDPMEIHLRGYSLTLRKADAAQILLREE